MQKCFSIPVLGQEVLNNFFVSVSFNVNRKKSVVVIGRRWFIGESTGKISQALVNLYLSSMVKCFVGLMASLIMGDIRSGSWLSS
jgi:hypothetical protein